MLNNEPTIMRLARNGKTTDHAIDGWYDAISKMQSWSNDGWDVSINEPSEIRRFAEEMDENERVENGIDAALALCDKAKPNQNVNDFGDGWVLMTDEETAKALASIVAKGRNALIEFYTDEEYEAL